MAEAKAGHPLTPASGVGVARRTSRRVTRRHMIAYDNYVRSLPPKHTTVVITGTTYYVHNGVYYRPYYEGSELIYIVMDKPGEEQIADPGPPPESESPPPPPPSEPKTTPEERMAELQNLYDKGYISEEEYNAKKRAILEGI